MLTDAALALSIGCEIKWLYNSATRLGRPVRRTMDEAIWWRLVHHLAVGLGAPVADAARAAETLLSSGMQPGRVRLRATSDESVSITVDLARFHDGAALALAAAQFLAIPRPRGRPRTKFDASVAPVQFTPEEMATVLQLRALTPAERLDRALNGLPRTGLAAGNGGRVLDSLVETGVPFVVIGQIAEATCSAPWTPVSLDLCADLTPRYATSVARALNALGAQPRGASTREGFQLDSALVRSVAVLVLRIGPLSVNVHPNVRDVGEYQQVVNRSTEIRFESATVRIATIDALVDAAAAGGSSTARAQIHRKSLLGALYAMDSATR